MRLITMTFAHVLLICTAGIAACAALVFAVETAVAFWFHEQDGAEVQVTPVRPVLLESPDERRGMDKAA